MLESLKWFCLTSVITLTGAINVKMDESVLEEKSSFKILGLTLSSKLDCWYYIMSIAKSVSIEIATWFALWSFFLPRLLFISINLYTIHPCTKYCCHVWTRTRNCYLKFLVKVQKQICRTVGPSLASSLEPLVHCRNVASLSLSYWCYFRRCSSELAQLVSLPFSRGRSIRYSDRLHDF